MREFTAAIAEFTESPTSPRFSLIPRASVQLQSEEHTAGLFLSQSLRLGRRFVQTLNHLTTTEQLILSIAKCITTHYVHTMPRFRRSDMLKVHYYLNIFS